MKVPGRRRSNLGSYPFEYCRKGVLCVPVWVLCGHFSGLGVRESLGALIGLQVDLNLVECPIRFGSLVGVPRVSVHVSVRVWRATITKKMHDLMNRFLMRTEVVLVHD